MIYLKGDERAYPYLFTSSIRGLLPKRKRHVDWGKSLRRDLASRRETDMQIATMVSAVPTMASVGGRRQEIHNPPRRPTNLMRNPDEKVGQP